MKTLLSALMVATAFATAAPAIAGGPNNDAVIFQTGGVNTGSVDQRGRNNNAVVDQDGFDNLAGIRQHGSRSNSAGCAQAGNLNTCRVIQRNRWGR